MRNYTLLLASLFGFTSLNAQSPDLDKPLFLGAGVSWLSYSGDLNADLDGFFFSAAKPEIHLFGEKRLHDWFGAKAELSWGQLTWQSRATYDYRNFQTDMFGGGLQGVLYFANDVIMPRSSEIRPYLATGISFYMLSVKSDLEDADGNTYYYWDDGTIRNMEENEVNAATAMEINRDYVNETKLDGIESGALVIPIEAGFHYRMNDMLDATLSYRYGLAMSDYLDGVAVGSNDSYHQVGLSLRLNHTSYTAPPEAFLEDVHRDDSDGDGVSDFNDECPDTPTGAKVDMKGCAKDTDGDGVPDYIDEEVESKSHNVDQYGVEYTEEEILEMQLPMREGVDEIEEEETPDGEDQ